jgi:cytoplasmic iron level regulating protein YaaA (DUF328/UPF0246 family)
MLGSILDMRSAEYRQLNPIPAQRDSYVVEVYAEDGKVLSHFNKKAKGLFVREALENNLTEIDQATEVAKAAGLRAVVEGRTLKLFAPR